MDTLRETDLKPQILFHPSAYSPGETPFSCASLKSPSKKEQAAWMISDSNTASDVGQNVKVCSNLSLPELLTLNRIWRASSKVDFITMPISFLLLYHWRWWNTIAEKYPSVFTKTPTMFSSQITLWVAKIMVHWNDLQAIIFMLWRIGNGCWYYIVIGGKNSIHTQIWIFISGMHDISANVC